MKIQAHPRNNEASALVVTLVLGVVLLVIMVSYLQLLGTQNKLVVRSESWNAALTMAEAGIEEALAQINASPNNLATNSWSVSGSTYGPVNRSLAGGSYSVIISNASSPVIYSTGFITVPVSGGTISRKVMVSTQKQGTANIGIGAKRGIGMNGNALAVNSYNSHLASLSDNGRYTNSLSKTSTNGNVATMSGIINSGNRNIYGNVYLAPGASLQSQPNSTITGTVYNNANIDFPDVTLPNVIWTAAPLAGGTHTLTTSGNYTVSDNYPVDVAAGVTVNLNVTTGVSYSPTSIAVHGGMTNSGTANIYLNGPPTLSMAGNSATDNSGRPENLRYYGLPSLTSVSMSGNSSFTGTLYAPQADVTLNGGGNNNLDFIGSLVGNTITMNGKFSVHYDESLSANGVQSTVVKVWQEL
jgi:Tfp pilus assembly protein PilX